MELLKKMRLGELRERCDRAGIMTSGLKGELLIRLDSARTNARPSPSRLPSEGSNEIAGGRCRKDQSSKGPVQSTDQSQGVSSLEGRRRTTRRSAAEGGASSQSKSGSAAPQRTMQLTSHLREKLALVLSAPGKDEECPLSLDLISNDSLEFLPSRSSYLKDHPTYRKATLPCGHSFGALNLLYHQAKSNMMCPCCRAGPKGRLSPSSIPSHLKSTLTRHLINLELESLWDSVYSAVLADDDSESEEEGGSFPFPFGPMPFAWDHRLTGDEDDEDDEDDDDGESVYVEEDGVFRRASGGGIPASVLVEARQFGLLPRIPRPAELASTAGRARQ